MMALQAGLGSGLDVARARAFNHTGPGQRTGFVVPDLASQVAKAARGELDRIATGNLEVSRDITDVRVVVRVSDRPFCAARRAPLTTSAGERRS